MAGLLYAGINISDSFLGDCILHEALDGYREYAREMPSRIIPGIWQAAQTSPGCATWRSRFSPHGPFPRLVK